MKEIFILQNSLISFDLDSKKIYQPTKYRLILIVNEFCYHILKNKKQQHYYQQILIIDDFSLNNILSIITYHIKTNRNFNVITNSEETMKICGEIRVFFGLDEENYSRFYDKHIMKCQLSKISCSDYCIPKYQLFDNNTYKKSKETYLKKLLTSLSFPLFIKPINLCSSRNTKKINNNLEFHQWASKNTAPEIFEIDNFIEGTMYHCDSYIKNNKVSFTLVCQNSHPCYDFTIGKVKGTIALPSTHQDTILLLKITNKILVDLGMPNSGVTHLELIKTKDNKIYFIEIAHRAPGCLIPKMHQIHVNLDPISAHYLLQIDPDYHPIPETKTFSAWACYPKIPGTVIKLKPLPKTIKSICKLDWKVRLGEKISTYSQSGKDYTGTIFMINKDFNTLYKEFLLINENNLCEIQPIAIN